MKRHGPLPFCLVCLLMATMTIPAPADRKTTPFSDEKVEQAIAQGVEELFSEQDPDGSWASHKGKYPVGITALVTYALLETGVSPLDPRMQKALNYLKRNDTIKTYSLAMRCQVWLSAARNMKNARELRAQLREDVQQLYKATKDGSYGYESDEERQSSGDHSNSQYGLLGVWAGMLANVEVPTGYWRLVRKYWQGAQHANGGWPYKRDKDNTRATMTAAGIASLYVCLENLQSRDYLECKGSFNDPHLERAMRRFEDIFPDSLRKGGNRFFYYLYGVERIGLASGYKYFGGLDWYKEGARRLLASNKDSPKNLSFKLLFLVRGRNPVLFNKLEYAGRWNNRPRDLANLTRWITQTFEKTVNWQIVNLRVPATEWHDAPILYIAGNQAPEFSDEDLDKLRRFVLQGGTILSVAECSGKAFTQAMRKTYQKILPNYELTAVAGDHPFYHLHYDVQDKARLSMIHNGVRPMVIHASADLARPWQAQNHRTEAWAYQTAANIYLYQTDKAKLRNRGVSHWPAESQTPAQHTVKVARIKYAGNYDPEPLAWQRFGRKLAAETGVKVEVTEPISLLDLPDSGAKLAAMTGTTRFQLNAAEIQAIKKYLAGGGKLLIDAAGGSSEFADALGKLPRQINPMAFPGPLPASHSIYNMGPFTTKNTRFRGAAKRRYHSRNCPQLRAMPTLSPNVFISREDITAALVGYECSDIHGYRPESAYRLVRNLVLYAGGIQPEQIQQAQAPEE
jgi:hypothetical protein